MAITSIRTKSKWLITQIWFNCVYLLYGAWNENAKISSQNSSSFPIAASPVNFWSTGLCCRSLMDEGLAPISSQTSFNVDYQSAFSRLELLFASATNSSKVIRWQETRVRLPVLCSDSRCVSKVHVVHRYQGLYNYLMFLNEVNALNWWEISKPLNRNRSEDRHIAKAFQDCMRYKDKLTYSQLLIGCGATYCCT